MTYPGRVRIGAVGLPLPKVTDPEVQRALDAIALAFPLGREHIRDGAVGSAQIEDEAVTPPKLQATAYEAAATADLTITTSEQSVVGAAVTVAAAGVYIVTASFDFHITVAGTATMNGRIWAGPDAQPGPAAYRNDAVSQSRVTASCNAVTAPVAAGTSIGLFAYKDAATGTMLAKFPSTRLTAIGPF